MDGFIRRLCFVSGIALLLGFASASFADSKRLYYLSRNTVDGSHAITACHQGYHMASLFEIIDTSNLTYNSSLGFRQDDDGFGPPSGDDGWIRTGNVSVANSHNFPGESNCAAWTTNSSLIYGTAAWLRTGWAQSGNVAAPFNAETRTCDTHLNVWCVQDDSE